MKKSNSSFPDDEELVQIDLTRGKFDLFELKKNVTASRATPPLDDEKNPLDLTSPNLDEEQFPLKKEAVDPKHSTGNEGEIFIPLPQKKRTKPPVYYAAIVTVTALLVFSAWLIFGFLYTHHYNSELYSRFHKGVNPEIYNESFDFFITLDGVTSPVVRSKEKRYTKGFNGMPMIPGTLTSTERDGVYTITGSSRLLPSVTEALVGKKVILEGVGFFEEYTVTSVMRNFSKSADLIIYVGSSSNDMMVINAEKSTPSH
ncbi:MAG: hypothetical protein IKV53_06555 [Clostridia bacterium]|nr:hypothetical protein [Clostridia bacterium]